MSDKIEICPSCHKFLNGDEKGYCANCISSMEPEEECFYPYEAEEPDYDDGPYETNDNETKNVDMDEPF